MMFLLDILIGALCAALCFAAAGVTLFGLSPAAGLGLLLILYSCMHFKYFSILFCIKYRFYFITIKSFYFS